MGLDFDFGDRGEFEFPWKENWLEGKFFQKGIRSGSQMDAGAGVHRYLCLCSWEGGHRCSRMVMKQVGQCKGHSYLLSSLSYVLSSFKTIIS